MNISPLTSSAGIDTSTVPIEDLAGNKNLTRQQKIHEASRQFEAIMLQQILSKMQSLSLLLEFTDDSTASGNLPGITITNRPVWQSMSGRPTDLLGFAGKSLSNNLVRTNSKPNSHVSRDAASDDSIR